jgi:hypothetical protein
VTPEERAKAVVAYFPAIPPKVRPEAERVIANAIRRALKEQLGKVEIEADGKIADARGIGKQAKFRDPAAIHFHGEWARRFRYLRTGKEPPHPFDLSRRPSTRS